MQVPNKNYKDVTQKGLVRWLLLLLVWMLILSAWRGFIQTRRGFLRLEEAEKRLQEVSKENQDLKMKLETVNSEEHKIKIVRDELKMQRSDEIVVVMPLDNNVIRSTEETLNRPIWRKWLELMI